MSLEIALVVAAALFGVGVYGALSQQTFVMIMMGVELMLNGSMLAVIGFWKYTAAQSPKGQVLAIVTLVIMAVEAAVGFALIIGIYRIRKADMTEKTKRLAG